MRVYLTVILGCFAMQVFAQHKLVKTTHKTNTNQMEIVSTLSNTAYLDFSTTKNTPAKVLQLRKLAANYNIKNLTEYNEIDPSSYLVRFNVEDNLLEVTYNQHGDIISSYELYKNVKLPNQLTEELNDKYPGWSINQTKLEYEYKGKDDVEKTYIIKVTHNNKRKLVKFNVTDSKHKNYLAIN
ncbi:MAG: hypothetical protein BM564_12295 [Bacteroidetes bacterium MedPE-SWsnd-G2]|nr:MAG: hypothetical protein BM564_12295 [Bacteroidetes bacterium MedPE-SWsnd-G2]